ncbi:hydroxymethylglutaryl-CoA synthase family protein [Actinobacteria bacterium YIM 96077]|uniref:3-hydroxy-3-methylglutaryl-ACP synthase n=1 Tax=Phytoactinopolyspora halophila TaxID=1981511 RepID=A0A329QD11_9ACTN|nr:hydroxymethylglutaryl-CoA synthase family protein [Actinobacteria bacterium YIM 96077]RAW10250.1 3-hydroxy-3-methylglutaryl-ACP synthase [Phytoactinopolyspora halophila]
MSAVGIEAMNFYGGTAYLDVAELAEHRNLETQRFENLLMHAKTVALPYEDPISLGVNAAKPIVDSLSDADRDRIELLVTCTESGIDFGKSISTYVHDYLGLNRNCRLFEVKNACYSGTAGFQMAVNFILAQVSPGAKALVVATDVSRFHVADAGEALSEDWSFAEPSGGAGAAALLVSDKPEVYQVDVGANGYYGYEVMDTCRPIPDSEAGNADLSLMSYLDCCYETFAEYQRRVPAADYRESFDYLAFHVPFGGMVKGAHRKMMRRLYRAAPQEIEDDFERRVGPGLAHCQNVGNVMGATVLLALLSTIDNGVFEKPKRIGCFSYGSGCCSEFHSGVVTPGGHEKLRQMDVPGHLKRRRKMSLEQYDALLVHNEAVRFGTRKVDLDLDPFADFVHDIQGAGVLILRRIDEFHREYEWL